jgi:hypothetical protein
MVERNPRFCGGFALSGTFSVSAQVRPDRRSRTGDRRTHPYVHLGMGGDHAHFDAVSERARTELGSWPSANGLLEQLVAALTETAEDEPEPERQSRLEATAAALAGMARDIAGGVITAQIGQRV